DLLDADMARFAKAIYGVRNHYAHTIANLRLGVWEILDKKPNEKAQRIKDLTGGFDVPAEFLGMRYGFCFIYMRFAIFLVRALGRNPLPPLPPEIANLVQSGEGKQDRSPSASE